MSLITRQAPSELNVESARNINVCTAFLFLFHRMTIVNFNLWSAHALSICGLFLRAHVAEQYIYVAWTYSETSVFKNLRGCAKQKLKTTKLRQEMQFSTVSSTSNNFVKPAFSFGICNVMSDTFVTDNSRCLKAEGNVGFF